MAPSAQERGPGAADPELETAVDDAIAACDDDARAAVRALLVAAHFLEAELRELRDQVDGITTAVSRGYARGRLRTSGGGEGR